MDILARRLTIISLLMVVFAVTLAAAVALTPNVAAATPISVR